MEKTEFIIEYFTKYLDFFVYSYLINTFLDSLTKDNIKSIGLPNHELKQINLHFDMIRKQLATTEKLQTLENIRQINEDFYLKIKVDIKTYFPSFSKLITLIEKGNRYSKIRRLIVREKNFLSSFSNEHSDTISKLASIQFEIALRKGKFYLTKKDEKDFAKFFKDLIKQSAIRGVNDLNATAEVTLKDHTKIEKTFNDHLYKKWKKPLDLLRLLIISSSEIGEEKNNFMKTNIVIEELQILKKIH